MLSSPVRAQQAPGVLNNPQAVGSEIVNSSVPILGYFAEHMPSSGTGSRRKVVEARVSSWSGGIEEQNVADLMYGAAYFRETEGKKKKRQS